MSLDRTALRLAAGALAPLTVDELADVLGCRPAAVRELVASLRPVSIGRARRYLLGEVIAAAREEPAEVAPPPRSSAVRLVRERL